MMTNRTRGCLKIQFLKHPFFEIKKEGISILSPQKPLVTKVIKILSNTNTILRFKQFEFL